jgi:hypothetical protein
MRLVIIVILLLFIVIAATGGWVFYKRSQNSNEKFKVLGTLAPYAPVYYKCVSECERSDFGKRLMPTKGSMACQEYCDSAITDISRRGGPSYPNEYPIAPIEVNTAASDAYKICGEGTKGTWCRQIYFSDREIDEKCRQDCKYSTDPAFTCMSLCKKSRSADKSLGWQFK